MKKVACLEKSAHDSFGAETTTGEPEPRCSIIDEDGNLARGSGVVCDIFARCDVPGCKFKGGGVTKGKRTAPMYSIGTSLRRAIGSHFDDTHPFLKNHNGAILDRTLFSALMTSAIAQRASSAGEAPTSQREPDVFTITFTPHGSVARQVYNSNDDEPLAERSFSVAKRVWHRLSLGSTARDRQRGQSRPLCPHDQRPTCAGAPRSMQRLCSRSSCQHRARAMLRSVVEKLPHGPCASARRPASAKFSSSIESNSLESARLAVSADARSVEWSSASSVTEKASPKRRTVGIKSRTIGINTPGRGQRSGTSSHRPHTRQPGATQPPPTASSWTFCSGEEKEIGFQPCRQRYARGSGATKKPFFLFFNFFPSLLL